MNRNEFDYVVRTILDDIFKGEVYTGVISPRYIKNKNIQFEYEVIVNYKIKDKGQITSRYRFTLYDDILGIREACRLVRTILQDILVGICEDEQEQT